MHFKNAMNYIILLSILSLFEYIPLFNPNNWFLVILFVFVNLVLHLYFIYNLCKGIEKVASRKGHITLERNASRRFKIYLWATIISAFVVLLLLMTNASLFGLLTFVAIIFQIISYVLVLALVWEAETRLGAR